MTENRYNILDIASFGEEVANNDVDATRHAIMNSKDLKNIVLGDCRGKRVIEARFDEEARAIYPVFDL